MDMTAALDEQFEKLHKKTEETEGKPDKTVRERITALADHLTRTLMAMHKANEEPDFDPEPMAFLAYPYNEAMIVMPLDMSDKYAAFDLLKMLGRKLLSMGHDNVILATMFPGYQLDPGTNERIGEIITMHFEHPTKECAHLSFNVHRRLDAPPTLQPISEIQFTDSPAEGAAGNHFNRRKKEENLS